MKCYPALFTLILAAALTNEARAENFIGWDSAYPKPGSIQGSALVKGQFTLDAGWEAPVSGTAYFWQDGSEVSFALPGVTFDPCTMTYTLGEGGIFGLVSGATYNVTIEVLIRSSDGSTTQTIRSGPSTVVPD